MEGTYILNKIVFILFLFCSTLSAQTTWFISPTGSDATGVGTSALPWRTFYKGIVGNTELDTGDKLYAYDGTYNEYNQIEVPIGISIEGQSNNVIIQSYYNGGAGNPLFKYETGTGGSVVYGNQSISYITIYGRLYTYAAIYINFRSNVTLDHVFCYNFIRQGIRFYGNPSWTWVTDNPYSDNPTDYTEIPPRFCTGNKISNSIISNCSDYYSGNGNGNLLVGQQDGLIIENCTITQTGRASGLNGYGIKFDDDGFNKNCKIRYNTITVAKYGDVVYEFAIEWWWDLGGTEIYGNRITGAIDLVHAVRGPGTTWGVKIYDNVIGYDSPQSQLERGILYEGRMEYVETYRNIIKYVSTAWYRPLHNYSLHDQLSNCRFYDNLLMNLDRTGGNDQIWGFFYPDYTNQDPSYNNWFYNNTIVANPSRTTRSMWGLQLPNGYETHGTHIRNNIIMNFDGAPIYASYSRSQFDTLVITNNIFYGNGNSNNPQWSSGFSPTNYTTNNIIKSDPLLISTTDYRLSTGSPAIRAGVNVSKSWLITDYAGLTWLSPPSIGAYEFSSGAVPVLTTTVISAIAQTTASGGGNITYGGGSAVSERGVCWNTTGNPTIADSHTSNGTSTGIYTSSLTGLTAYTYYYVRAFATNSSGTAYGNVQTFTTLVTSGYPVLTTSEITDVVTTTATSGGVVTSDGGDAVTDRGVCWSTGFNPVITDFHTHDGTGTGTFVSSLTTLNVGWTYFVRAYAINANGTTYGNERYFTAGTVPPITTGGFLRKGSRFLKNIGKFQKR